MDVIQNYGKLMQLKKTASKCDRSQAEDFIAHLKTGYGLQDFKVATLLKDRVGQFFSDLHLHISGRDLYHLSAYEGLNDGLYVLLKGQISYAFVQYEQNKKGIGICKSSTSINQTWTVFECTFKNCTTLEETYLLRLGEEQAGLARFYDGSVFRKELYERQYLSQDHYSLVEVEGQKSFQVDVRIHSNFSFKKFHFRQIVSLDSPAILSQGRAKLKSSNIHSHEFDRFGVLLPGLSYQISSSEAQVMAICKNDTLAYQFQLIQAPKKRIKMKIKNTYNVYRPQPAFIKEQEQQNRDLSKLFKQSETYSIISAFLCQKGLILAKKQNEQHCTRQKKEGRYRNPLILFNLSNQKSKLVLPTFQDMNASQSHNHPASRKSTNSQQTIFKKLKLPPADYERFLKKRKLNTSQTLHAKLSKSKWAFNLTLDGFGTEGKDEDEIQFMRYNK